MAEADQVDFVVFFSWQSDLAGNTNTNVIRECLRDAASQLESEFAADKLHVVLDEATRGRAGSPNIPKTILEKIAIADAFIADMTTVNGLRAEGQRPMPNPNVSIELGYAVAMAGWERIVMLFNTAHGSFPDDMPFDVDRHRASPYKFSHPLLDEDTLSKKQKAERLAAMKTPLKALLIEALCAIWLQKPLRPAEQAVVPPEVRKKQRDTAALEQMFSTLNLLVVEEFIEDLEVGKINQRSFHFWESFNGLFGSPLFHVYDEKLKDLVSKFHAAWQGCHSFSQHFVANAGHTAFIFHTPGDAFSSKRQEDDWKLMQKFRKSMRRSFDALLAYVRVHYVEIDLKETSAAAWREYVEFHNEMKKLTGD